MTSDPSKTEEHHAGDASGDWHEGTPEVIHFLPVFRQTGYAEQIKQVYNLLETRGPSLGKLLENQDSARQEIPQALALCSQKIISVPPLYLQFASERITIK